MLTIASDVFLEGVTGTQITDFMLNPTDDRYRRWWPGTHLRFHTLVEHPGHVGDVVMMESTSALDGSPLTGVATDAVTGRRITWQLRRWVTLPVRLTLELTDRDGGVALRHIVHAGFDGAGRLLDPILGSTCPAGSPPRWTPTSRPSFRCSGTSSPATASE